MKLRGRKKERGSSLLEALVAGSVLLISLASLGALSIAGASNGRSGSQTLEGAQLADQYTSQYLAMGYLTVANLPTPIDEDVTMSSGRAYHVNVDKTISGTTLTLKVRVTSPTNPGLRDIFHESYLSQP